MADEGMAYVVMARARARKYLPVTAAYGTCTMHVWLAAACPKTLIVTLGDVLESGNARNQDWLRKDNLA